MKKIVLFIMATILAMGCSEGFSSRELEIINGGEGGIMPVMLTTNKQDSLLLRSHSLPLSEQMVLSKDFKTLRERMLLTVQDPDNEGVGIAAPQVGILRKVVAVQRFDKEGEPFEFYINPQITSLSEQKALGGEGCLSVPEEYGEVMRSQSIEISYRDENFTPHTEQVEGFTAVIFQHEIDHLNGVLFIDKMEPETEEEKELENENENEKESVTEE